MKLKFTIEGLDCANCANELECKINKLEGIESASISFMSQKMIVNTNSDNQEEIIEKITHIIRKEEPDVTIKLK